MGFKLKIKTTVRSHMEEKEVHEPHIPGPYRTSNRGTNYSLVLVNEAHITRNSHFVNQNKLETQTQDKKTCKPFSHVYFECL